MSDGWFNRCHFGDVRAVLRQMIEAGVKPAAMHGKEFFAFIRRKLFDPDYRWLRTSSIRW